LRSSCESGYLLANKEDEARTIDLMRVLLAYGFESINGSVANRFLLKQKPVRTVVRKLLHEVAKLSAVPIDPNLPPPVIKRPPTKVKQPPTPPRKRVGRDCIDMKKGDWLCPKYVPLYEFMTCSWAVGYFLFLMKGCQIPNLGMHIGFFLELLRN